MKNAELYSKGATVMYGLHPLAARLPELASKTAPTGITPSTGENIRATAHSSYLSHIRRNSEANI